MARRVRPDPWDSQEVKNVEGLLMSFNGDRATVCAVMGCARGDLDWLCKQAFGMGFDKAVEKYELVGKAKLRHALFKSAESGNSKALDMLARERLDLGPVEQRRKRVAPETEEVTDF